MTQRDDKSSSTPRTDAMVSEIEDSKKDIWQALNGLQRFARQLERELAARSHEAVDAGCPCTIEGIEPCSSACSCAHRFHSGGCSRCARYGSLEQQQSHARFIADAVTAAAARPSEGEREGVYAALAEGAVAAARPSEGEREGVYAALAEGAAVLLQAAEMEEHNELIFTGKWKKGSKAWSGEFIKRLRTEGMAKVREAMNAPRSSTALKEKRPLSEPSLPLDSSQASPASRDPTANAQEQASTRAKAPSTDPLVYVVDGWPQPARPDLAPSSEVRFVPYTDAEKALQAGVDWDRCPVGTFTVVLGILRAYAVDVPAASSATGAGKPVLLSEWQKQMRLLQEAADGLYNGFEPDNQSALWLRINAFLKSGATDRDAG